MGGRSSGVLNIHRGPLKEMTFRVRPYASADHSNMQWKKLAIGQDNCLGSRDRTLDEICHLLIEQCRTCRSVLCISKSCAYAGLPVFSVKNVIDPGQK